MSYLEKVIDVDGETVIAAKQTPAESIALAGPDIAEILNQTQIDALAQVETLTVRVAEKAQLIETLAQQLAQFQSQQPVTEALG